MAVVIKAQKPFIYHSLAAALLFETETEGGYSAFGLSGTSLRKYLTQKPKKPLRAGMISGSLISALYDFYVLRDIEVQFNP